MADGTAINTRLKRKSSTSNGWESIYLETLSTNVLLEPGSTMTVKDAIDDLQKGSTSVSVTGASVDNNGDLIISLSNNQTKNLGKVRGDSAGFGTPEATVDSNTGAPGVTVSSSGSDSSKVFTFSFTNLKGEKGDTPVKGVDYFTDADKTDIVNQVIQTLPDAEEANF